MKKNLLFACAFAFAVTGVQSLHAQTLVQDATGVSVARPAGNMNVVLSAAAANSHPVHTTSSCPSISCAGNIQAYADSTSCGAVVNYSAPTATNLCSTTADTFSYSGSIVTWTVPAGVTSIHIDARGAQGGTNGSSTVAPGLGAIMTGDFTVTPGQQLKILVGENNNAGNGGGGGTFVTDITNTPLIVAGGGGGGSEGIDSPNKHGQVGTTGATGAGGGGTGGSGGNGGNAGASFNAGAGGGLLTNGADGWTAGSGGQAFVNGGAGANVGFGIGGFGGGGNGSGYVVGAGGGGYSGGGGGSNSTGTGGVGGGGGSYNAGTNQLNTGGANTGNGLVIISYVGSTTLNITQIAGLASGSNFPVGSTTQTFVVDDGIGNTDTCSFTVTVDDTIAPVYVCQQNISVNADSGMCSAVVTFSAPTATDNCTFTSSQTAGLPSGSAFPVGTTTVTYTATDSSGNSTTCSFDITVTDAQAPQFSCPTTMTVNNDSGMCSAVVTYSPPTVTDNCNVTSLTLTGGLASGSAFPLGTTTITYTALDSAGNSSTCSFDVIVIDAEAPTITCSNNITVCAGTSAQISAVATDLCSGVASIDYVLSGATTGTGSGNTFVTFNAGTTTVTYTATDSAGNSSSCNYTVTAVNATTPMLSAANLTPCVNDGLDALSASPSNGAWSGTGVSGTNFDPFVAGTGPHVLTYNFTDSLGCDGTGVLTINVNPCTGITESGELSAMQVAPNPSNGTLSVTLGAQYNEVEFTLVQVNGQVVQDEKRNDVSSADLDLTTVAPGIYFLTVNADGAMRTVKIVRE